MGRSVDAKEFARICLALEAKGAENINIVTGSHAAPAVAGGIDAARAEGLLIPVLWNSSAYENPRTLELLEGRIDGWLPDLKTLDPALADRFFHAPDYPDAARTAVLTMLEIYSGSPAGPRQGPSPEAAPFIIRHLVLPGRLASTRQVLRWFAEHAAGRAQLSLMTQYTPPEAPAAPNRRLNREEYAQALDWLEEFGIEEGFCQEPVTDDGWFPDFRRPNPFPSKTPGGEPLSVPVWHWREGFV
jgi:putative pyruvate formate lyase activating enzyme